MFRSRIDNARNVADAAVKTARARLAEAVGSERYSWPALNLLDRLVVPYLPAGPGTFLEIGANSGYLQSNTYYLERRRGWAGILIEPLPVHFRMCRFTRPSSTCFNVACVAPDGPTTVELINRTLESVVLGSQSAADETKRLAARRPGATLTVPTKTLSACIDESPFDSITFMSVDVEGAEFSLLAGLDWDRHCPDWLLIETDYPERLVDACPGMIMEAQLSFHDYLLRNESVKRAAKWEAPLIRRGSSGCLG
jgi:FkbM family methyltransferase